MEDIVQQDIDIDICPSKRPLILQKIKEERGRRFIPKINDITRENCGCTLVATFGTETSKSAILTAARGYRSEEFPEGLDSDFGQYLSSLVPVERGFVYSLKDMVFGNPDKGRKPVTTFVNEVNQYEGLLKIMFGIEGLISRRGSHASGVILFDEDPYVNSCFMKTPSGDVITQYDLHDAEAAGMTKYDMLVTEVSDKIVETLKFLQDTGEIEKDLTLRELYNKYLHPDVLPLEDEKTWESIKGLKVLDLFQFDSDVGSLAVKKVKPNNIIELSDCNGLLRLMTAEEGGEQPLDKYVRFKNNINLWYDEMKRYGLSAEEQKAVEPYFKPSFGVPPSQEVLMQLLMDKNVCNFSLGESNMARKLIAKKLMDKIPELQEKVLKTAKSEKLGRYIWDCCIKLQLGYSFSLIHSLAYTIIGFQTAYLATRWNPIYWNTACLKVNSGGLEDTNKGTDYSKVAKAIGAIKSRGIAVSLTNINTSDYSYMPDIENNRILYGLSAISNISGETIEKIKAGRPYIGIKDFMIRCPLNKTATINLIKSGAFDEIDKSFKTRREVMIYYISQICEPKKRLTLQNFNGLIQHNLIPQEYELQVRVFNFNKYLKSTKYELDTTALLFFDKFLSEYNNELEIVDGVGKIAAAAWEKIYKKIMSQVRTWITNNQDSLLKEYNVELFLECWNKYATGTISHWEMESLCFYYHEHELANVDKNKYGIINFNSLSPTSAIDYYFKRGGKQIPIFKLSRIAGTVLAKDDTKSSITLLTTDGVCSVKFSREQYAKFKKQISQIQPDGTKKVVEKGWFSRGSLLLLTGYRREDTFVVKTYKNTSSHQIYKITDVVEDKIILQHERADEEGCYEEE